MMVQLLFENILIQNLRPKLFLFGDKKTLVAAINFDREDLPALWQARSEPDLPALGRACSELDLPAFGQANVALPSQSN